MKSKLGDFECPQNAKSIVDKLNSSGIVVIREFLAKVMISRLNSRFESWMNRDSISVLRRIDHPRNPGGVQAFVCPDVAASSGETELFDVFRLGLVRAIAEEFFSPQEFRLNPAVVLTHLQPASNPILPWHFDRMQSLKFWIYLDDASEDNGALEYCPGTHWEGRYRASYHMATGTAVKNIPNDVPDHRIQHPLVVDAKAGDLIVFDPDGFHRGGVVKPGNERRVIRADTFPLKTRRYSDFPMTGGWWLRSIFNLARWLKVSGSRTLGDRTKDTTTRRERSN